MASNFSGPPSGWLKYLAQKYRCPVCDTRLTAFLPAGWDRAVLVDKAVIGGGRRNNVLCPNCGSWDRLRLVFLFLRNRQLLSNIQSLLHIAPESHLRRWLESLPEMDYVTADLDEPDVHMKMDLTNIELPDARFDAIICCHVLEHIVADRKAMSELYRVLKPGGWAILQVPISANSATYEDASIVEPSEQERAFGQSGHVRIYGMDYMDRLKMAGFTVEVFEWQSEAERFGGRENIFGLIENEPLFFAKRPL